MSTERNEYLFLFRGGDWKDNCSPQEMQNLLGQFMGWFDRLTQEGVVKVGQPLAQTGKVVRKGRQVSDGPFAESKEAVGGYFLVLARTLDEAVEIAQQNPLLEYGLTVEVRPVAENCPIAESLQKQQLTPATA
jgi:hypothetical protein